MKTLLSVLLLLSLSAVSHFAIAQKYLAIDSYGTKRLKLEVGDDIHFKIKGDKTLFYDKIKMLNDSSVVMEKSDTAIPLHEFEEFRFKRKGVNLARAGALFLGAGYLFAAAIHPAVSNPEYDQKEATIIGSSFIAANIILRFFKWKKYNVAGERSRVQILETTIQKPEEKKQ